MCCIFIDIQINSLYTEKYFDARFVLCCNAKMNLNVNENSENLNLKKDRELQQQTIFTLVENITDWKM